MSERFKRACDAAMRAGGRFTARIRGNAKAMWMLRVAARYALVIAAVILYSVILCRSAQNKALKTYEGWFEQYRIEQEAAAEAAKAEALAVDPYEIQINAEAEELARVLYGVRNNSDNDLRTYCWCVLNRVDHRDYPDTLEEVIAQPQQWMRYSEDNPVVEKYYRIAREELDAWHTGTTRPCSSEFVFMNWSPNDLCLRDNWEEGSRTHYWRYGQ